MRVLAIAAHPDDAELGAGGTLAKHVLTGDVVAVFAFGAGRPGGSQQFEIADAARMLGAEAGRVWGAQSLEDQAFDRKGARLPIEMAGQMIALAQPDVVYTHSAADLNRDHRIVHEAVLVACRPVPGRPHPKRLLAFEVPGTTDIGVGVFRPSVFVDVHGEPLARKLKALACYQSEMRDFPHPRSGEAVLALAKWRGATVGLRDAEAFEELRSIE